MTTGQTNEQLGFSADARLLIINADDFGLCHAINAAIFHTLVHGIVTSATIMMPCPWAFHATQLLREHPTFAFGVHLTAICDTTHYKFGPLTPKAQVPSIVDESGYFYSFERMAEFLAKAKLDELETEFRAQIESVLSAQLQPSHLDWHCIRFGWRTDIPDLMFGLAKEYGLAMRVIGQPMRETAKRHGLPTIDYDFMDSFSIELADKPARYREMLRNLPTGLSEWAVHPGIGNEELQVMNPSGLEIRASDFDFLRSPEAQAIVNEEGIILIDYRLLQRLSRTA